MEGMLACTIAKGNSNIFYNLMEDTSNRLSACGISNHCIQWQFIPKTLKKWKNFL